MRFFHGISGIVTSGLQVLCVLAGQAAAQINAAALPVEDEAVKLEQKLGEFIAKDARFLDDQGRKVKIGDYFKGDVPAILNLGYYNCPSICGPVLNALVDSLKQVDLNPGVHFRILSASINPKEGSELATLKKQAFVNLYGRAGAAEHWHFLTGDAGNRDQLCSSVGWNFRWNETMQDYNHLPVIVFLSPEGKITRYFQGVYYEPRDMRLALVEASDGKIGNLLDRFVLSCYGYDPVTRKYSLLASRVMTAGGVLTLAALAAILFVLWRRERRQVVLSTP